MLAQGPRATAPYAARAWSHSGSAPSGRLASPPAPSIRPGGQASPRSTVVAVAARDRDRAERFAKKHNIPTAHDSYEALVADPDVDAVYNPLPNGLHGRWTLAALEAGKHVLCEKPFTANAEEAERVAAAAGPARASS